MDRCSFSGVSAPTLLSATLSDDEVLRRLVALNAERAEEERRAIIHSLRPEFQNPAAPHKPNAGGRGN